MKKTLFVAAFFTCLGLLNACSSNSTPQVFVSPSVVGVDSTNDRTFVIEKAGRLFAYTASDFTKILREPLVDKNNQETIHQLLPANPSHLAVSSNGTNSRLFIAGAIDQEAGGKAFNQILVLDFDGTQFTQADFSPLEVGTDPEGIIGDLHIEGSTLYVTRKNTGALFAFSTTTGDPLTFDTNNDDVPEDSIPIDGIPNKMAFADGRLYVANSTAEAADQLITVLNTADDSLTTIDLDIPTNDISVASNGGGIVLLAKHAALQEVKVLEVNDLGGGALGVSDVSADNTSNSLAEDGLLTTSQALSASVGMVFLATDSEGVLYGYVPQYDGQVTLLNFAADLSSYQASSLSSGSRLINGAALYSSGSVRRLYFVAPASGEVSYTPVGSSTFTLKF